MVAFWLCPSTLFFYNLMQASVIWESQPSHNGNGKFLNEWLYWSADASLNWSQDKCILTAEIGVSVSHWLALPLTMRINNYNNYLFPQTPVLHVGGEIQYPQTAWNRGPTIINNELLGATKTPNLALGAQGG